MRFSELPEADQKVIRSLRHSSGTIEYDVLDSLGNANNLNEFRQLVKESMQRLIDEAYGIKKLLGEP